MKFNYSSGVFWRALAFFGLYLGLLFGACAEEKIFEDKLGPGDVIRVFVYKSADLSAEFRVQENGQITFPLVGMQKLAGLTLPDAEKQIGDALVKGGFLQAPQVSISLVSARHRQALVLGYVPKPGVISLEYVNTRLSDVLAAAGGIAVTGSDTVVVTGQRKGVAFRSEINIADMYLDGKKDADLLMEGGDVVYVHRAEVFYVHGEVQRPGSYRLEHHMTLQQALVTAGGLTRRGSDSGLRVQRRLKDGKVVDISPALSEQLLPDDVIFAKESLF